MNSRRRLRYWLKNLAIKTGTIKIVRRIRDRLVAPGAVDYRLLEQTGETPLPISVTIEPTLACNLHCFMCYQNDYRDRGIAKELHADGLLEVVRQLPPSIQSVYFVGGEVFLKQGFPRLLDAVDDRGLETFITTNGTRIGEKDWAALDRMRRLTGIGFSLDGIGTVHDAIRGEGTYEKIVENIRRARGQHRVYVSFVMMESNVHQMTDFAVAVAGVGVREIGFQHEIYCRPDEIAATRRELGWTPQDEIMMTAKLNEWSGDSIAKLYDGMSALRKLERRHRFVAAFEPPLPPEILPSFYDGTIRKRMRLFCRELTNLRIDPAGNMIHCAFLRKKFGNVLEQPAEKFWNSVEMRDFRKALLDGNLTPACRRCCKLGQWPGDAPLPEQVASAPSPSTGTPLGPECLGNGAVPESASTEEAPLKEMASRRPQAV